MPVDLTLRGEQLLPQGRVLPDQVLEDLADRRALRRHAGVAAGSSSEDVGQTYVDWHLGLQRIR